MESILKQLAETGLLGLLLTICIFVIYFLYKENKSERNARLEDLKQYANDDNALKIQIKQTLENILALIGRGKT